MIPLTRPGIERRDDLPPSALLRDLRPEGEVNRLASRHICYEMRWMFASPSGRGRSEAAGEGTRAIDLRIFLPCQKSHRQ